MELFLYCSECKGFLGTRPVSEKYTVFHVPPCEVCRNRAMEQAYNEGRDSALETELD